MSDTQKPPMVVWLTGKHTPCEASDKRQCFYSETGPYVHLDQFLAEVERRAGGEKSHCDYRYYEAVQELTKELKQNT